MPERTLPVIIPSVPGQRWSCHSCGLCCRALVGHVTAEERARIDEQGWADELGIAPYIRAGRRWVLNKRDDGACVFLDEHNRCRIHSRHGEAAKPLACRVFPFSVRPVPGGWQASFRFDCPSSIESKGEPLTRHREALQRLVRELHHHARERDALAKLPRGISANVEEIDAVIGHYRDWLRDTSLTMTQRLRGAARVTTMLSGATLRRVRGPRFVELLDLLFGALPNESHEAPDPPTARQRGMLRQLAFAHAEHVTLAQLQEGWFGRLATRLRQLQRARLFLAGEGNVPAIPGFVGPAVTFATVEAVSPSVAQREAIEDLQTRYLTARLESRSVFGAGYYGWPISTGLSALWLSVAAAGWLARYAAAQHGRRELSLDDVAIALGVVDRAATRLPALGTLAERGRVAFLQGDDGIARLIEAGAWGVEPI